MSSFERLQQPVPVTLIERRQETPDTVTYAFAFPEEARGQFRFDPGQFTMLSLFGVGEAPISISGFDRERDAILHTIRHVGNVTHSISRLKEGDVVQLRGPYGTGWPLKEAEGRYLVFLTGGIGLAPLVPAIDYAWQNRGLYEGIEVLFGARTPKDRLFEPELAAWKQAGTRVQEAVDMVPEGQEWDRHVGFVIELIPDIQAHPDDVVVFMCGPEIMMKVAARLLKQWGLKSEQLHVSLERRMKCGMGTCGNCQIGPFFVCKDGPVFNLRSLEVVPAFK